MRVIRHRRLRSNVVGTQECPRMAVYKSLRNISVQFIDDMAGNTLVAASTLEKSVKENSRNVFPIDGFLESIPFPDNSFDILFTSNAIGWNIEEELKEIERVVKPNGQAFHIMRVNENIDENPVHEKLISSKWNYKFSKTSDENGLKLKYIKTIK